MDSLTSSWTQVQLNPSPGGPITRIPNELVHAFLIKLEMHELIRLRLVCPRWKAVIESIAQTKKSMILSGGYYVDPFDSKFKNHSFHANKRFFGQIDNLKRDFVLIQFKYKAFSNACDYVPLFGTLFPSVEQLVIHSSLVYGFYYSVLTLWPVQQITTLSLSCDFNHYSSYQVTPFVNWFNSLTALKRLDLKGEFMLLLKWLSPQIMANLEHFSHDAGKEPCLWQFVNKKFLGHLGTNCTRLSLSGYGNHLMFVLDWFNVDLIRGLTHLSLPLWKDLYRVWEELCDKLVSLQTLCIQESFIGKVNVLSSRFLNILSRLPNLTELQLYGFAVDKNFDRAPEPERKFIALVNVRTFVLHLDRRYHQESSTALPDRDRLTQFLVDNFLPNIQQLTIEEH